MHMEPPETLKACVCLTPPCFPPIHHPFLKPGANQCAGSSCPGPCLILPRPTRAGGPRICPGPATWTSDPATWTSDPELQPAEVCIGTEHKDFKTGTLTKLTTWPSAKLRLSWAPCRKEGPASDRPGVSSSQVTQGYKELLGFTTHPVGLPILALRVFKK